LAAAQQIFHGGEDVLILLQRDDCQLCDEALAVLSQARVPAFTSVFIDGQAVLEARYGDRVPVLRDDANDSELNWPFDTAGVQHWLTTRGSE